MIKLQDLPQQPTRVHQGEPTWWKIERLEEETVNIDIQLKVSYKWLNGKWLLALITGKEQLTADYQELSKVEQPTQALNKTMPGNQSAKDQVRDAKNENNIIKQDCEVILEIRRGMWENMCDTLGSGYTEDVVHIIYGFNEYCL